MNIEKLTQQKTQERFLAIEELLQQLQNQKYPEEVQDFVEVLLGNYSDSNFRVVQLSMECIKLLYPVLKCSKSLHAKIFQESILQFKNIRIQVKQSALELAVIASKNIEQDILLSYIETNIVGKNPGQKVFTVQLMKELYSISVVTNKAKIIQISNKLVNDAAPDVRLEAQNLINDINAGGQDNKQQGGNNINQKSNSIKQNIKSNAKHNPQNSLFPPPENNDLQSQSQTFSLVPPESYSYYSYKPLYCYELPWQLKQIIDPLLPFKDLQTKKPEQLRQYIEKAFEFMTQSKDWTQQMIGIQFIIGLIVYYLNIDNTKMQVQISQILQEHFLQYLASIGQCLTSQRSVLQREMAILLEISFQRYGKLFNKLAESLIDPCFKLLVMKGVYTENAADSLIKTIIIHTSNKSVLFKIITLLKTTKLALYKFHIMDYLCLYSILDSFDPKIQFFSNQQEIEQLLKIALSDPNPRPRGAGKAFANYLEIINPSLYRRILQANPILQKSGQMEAGFLNYECYVSIQIQDDEFPGYFLQGGSCHAEIVPLPVDLQNWRYQLICGEQFQLKYQNLSDQQLSQIVVKVNVPQQQFEEEIIEVKQPIQQQKPVLLQKQPPPAPAPQKQQQQKLQNPPKQVQFEDFDEDLEFADPNTYKKPKIMQPPPQIEIPSEQDDPSLDDIDVVVNQVIQTPKSDNYPTLQTAINLKQLLAQTVQKPISADDSLQNLIDLLTQPDTDVELTLTEIPQYLSISTPVNLVKSLLILLLDFLQAEEIQQTTLTLLTIISKTQPEAFSDLLDFAIPIINSIFRSPNLDVRRTVNDLLLLLCNTQPPQAIFTSFSSILKAENDILANAALRFLAVISRKFTYKKELKQYVNLICADVIRNFDADTPEIRKSATACFIDFYFLLGEDFSVWIQQLPADKLKFIVMRMKAIRSKEKQ